jgi:hypothetical protein
MKMHPGITGRQGVAQVTGTEDMPSSVHRPNDAKSELVLASDNFIKVKQKFTLKARYDEGVFDGMTREQRKSAGCKVYTRMSEDDDINMRCIYRDDAVPQYKKRKFAEIESSGVVVNLPKAQKYELQAALKFHGLPTTGSKADLLARYTEFIG